jgi:hypothetical protein
MTNLHPITGSPRKQPLFRLSQEGVLEILCRECEGTGEIKYLHDPTGQCLSVGSYIWHDDFWWKYCWRCQGQRYVGPDTLDDLEVAHLNDLTGRGGW